MAEYKLDWKGKAVIDTAEDALADIIDELAEIAKREAQAALYPGHGVLSGELKASIEISEPGFGSLSSLGSTLGGQYTIAVGSDLVYAMAINQGWPWGYPGLRGSFSGYHFMNKGLDAARANWSAVVQKHRLR